MIKNNYDSYRGWLASKQYADSKGPSYAYTPAGRLQSRTWARKVAGQALLTTYGYDLAGGLHTVTYSDSTPGVTYTVDRLGRSATITRNGITTTLTHNLAGEQQSESYSGGILNSLSVASTYDTVLRRSTLALNYQLSTLNSVTYGYDLASRLQTVTDNSGTPAYSATYSNIANSPLVGQITFKQSATTRMTTTKQYDYLNRLSSVSSSLASFAYVYNSANQRIRVTLADGSYWVYSYDNLGQVLSGNKYWSDGSPVAGQQFEYGFDDIGNRNSTAAGGDNAGQGLHSASYTANNLNQYTQRTVPGYADSLGTANANATVTLWRDDGSYASTQRKGSYFWAELPVNNASAALWLTLTNLAVLNNGSNPDIVATTVGHEFLPQTPEHYTYDDDGNLTQDGHWNYTWDAENRLVKLTPSTLVAPQISLAFEYDWQGRRIHKQVWNGPNWTGSITNDVKFLYDGWNLIAILNPQSSLLQSFTWGLDLSGSAQGAGGIGGLLFIGNWQSPIGYYAPAFDGNGNVSALMSMSGGTNSATYEYGPFGEVIRATGPMAKANPFRFSTKYQDDETDLVRYEPGRYYGPSCGAWLSRDPVAELGFLELVGPRVARGAEAANGISPYRFVRNNPVSRRDPLGLLDECPPPPTLPPVQPGEACCNAEKIALGLMVLKHRWSDAVRFLNSNGAKTDPEAETGVSCVESANRILAFMAPIPRCWKCYIQRRSWKWDIWDDENSILCEAAWAQGRDWTPVVAFDWFYFNFTGQTDYHPIPQWKYQWMFVLDLNPTIHGWWTKDNPAPHDDCTQTSNIRPERYEFLRQLLPPYPGHQN